MAEAALRQTMAQQAAAKIVEQDVGERLGQRSQQVNQRVGAVQVAPHVQPFLRSVRKAETGEAARRGDSASSLRLFCRTLIIRPSAMKAAP